MGSKEEGVLEGTRKCLMCSKEYNSANPKPWTCDNPECNKAFLDLPLLVRALLSRLMEKANITDAQDAIKLLDEKEVIGEEKSL